MLILTRNVGESITINNNIVIDIVETKNCHVKLGITAPKNVLVLRNELLKQTKTLRRAKDKLCNDG
ncbi:MAG: carbon storage regulator [Planctomycetaceae bacterium]|jgi:carbon storage regulator|nr:carbon storage regulator [Planctomycetaceae bacterium]